MTAPGTEWDGILHPGERILWQGRPDGKVAFSAAGLVVSVFGLVFVAVAAGWTMVALSIPGGAGVLMALFGLPFAGIGLYLTVGHWFVSARLRRRTFYTLTDRRALVGRTSRTGRTLDSHPIGPETELELIEGPPDTIWFAREVVRHDEGESIQLIGFERIADGRQVLALMRQVQRGAAA